jgi:hypothetical protein
VKVVDFDGKQAEMERKTSKGNIREAEIVKRAIRNCFFFLAFCGVCYGFFHIADSEITAIIIHALFLVEEVEGYNLKVFMFDL